jgi:hypothetical protein
VSTGLRPSGQRSGSGCLAHHPDATPVERASGGASLLGAKRHDAQDTDGGRLSATTLETIAPPVGETLQQKPDTEAPWHRTGRSPLASHGATTRPEDGLPAPSVWAACPRPRYGSVDGSSFRYATPGRRMAARATSPGRYAEGTVGVVYETNQDQDAQDTRVAWQADVASFQEPKPSPRWGVFGRTGTDFLRPKRSCLSAMGRPGSSLCVGASSPAPCRL